MYQRNQANTNDYQPVDDGANMANDVRFHETPPLESSQPFRMLRIEIVDPCYNCAGKGRIGASQPYCGKCRQTWTMADFERFYTQHARGRWRGWNYSRRFKRLACRHRVTYLRYTNPTCKVCRGTGGMRQQVTLTWLATVLERLREHRRQSNTTRPMA